MALTKYNNQTKKKFSMKTFPSGLSIVDSFVLLLFRERLMYRQFQTITQTTTKRSP